MWVRGILLFLCVFSSNLLLAQRSVAEGRVSDIQNQGLQEASIQTQDGRLLGKTSQRGAFSVTIDSSIKALIVSLKGYLNDTLRIDSTKNIHIILNRETTQLGEVVIEDQRLRQSGMQQVNARNFQLSPNASQTLESMLKQLPGVSTNNELSSQYSVRGGNFDENLIYINDIQIYKPYLVRNGQQEGLSLINPDLAGEVKFSAGGFSAAYGDKMSSVLDVRYAKPKKSGVEMSLATNGLSLSGKIKGQRADLVFGYRQKNNQSLLSGQDMKGAYQPDFNDLQGIFNYKWSSQWSGSVMGIVNDSRFVLVPESRETTFGTLQQAYTFKVNYSGQEVDSYQNRMAAFTLQYQANHHQIKWINSYFSISEKEHFDIYGDYVFEESDDKLLGGSYGNVESNRGIGAFQDYGRNELNAKIWSSELRWNLQNGQSSWQSGFRFQHENITDQLYEFNLLDSAGYAIPQHTAQFDVLDYRSAENAIPNTQFSGFLTHTRQWNLFNLNAGLRMNYNSFTKEFIPSPRFVLTYRPLQKKDILYRLAGGLYIQPPFYREMRGKDGTVNPEVKSQKSVHAIVSSDYRFDGLGTRLTFSTEWYFKYLFDLVPYELDNLRIRYLADRQSKGYATGIDLSLRGEMVEGLESSFRLSFMQTREDVENDGLGYIRRPTDQRVNFSAFFQDKLFNSPTYKVHFNLLFGSRLPTKPPRDSSFDYDFTIPAYRRLDIGFSKNLVDSESRKKIKFLSHNFDALILYAEVFNLLNINNTVSYLWVRDVRGDDYAIPNYMTSRQLNFKIIAKF